MYDFYVRLENLTIDVAREMEYGLKILNVEYACSALHLCLAHANGRSPKDHQHCFCQRQSPTQAVRFLVYVLCLPGR